MRLNSRHAYGNASLANKYASSCLPETPWIGSEFFALLLAIIKRFGKEAVQMSVTELHKEEHFFIVKNGEVIVKSDIQQELLEQISEKYCKGQETFEVQEYFVHVVETSQGTLFTARSLKQFNDIDFMNPCHISC